MKWLLLFPLCCLGQPILKPVGFTWDAPTNAANVIGYELQWGTGFAQLPTNILEYTVPTFPLAFNQRVQVSSVGSTANSIPTAINVYNLVAYLEETEDFTNWNTIKSVQLTGERKQNSFLRVRLDVK